MDLEENNNGVGPNPFAVLDSETRVMDYAPTINEDKDFLEWLEDERLVMYDMSLMAQGKNLEDRYTELLKAFEEEEDWE